MPASRRSDRLGTARLNDRAHDEDDDGDTERGEGQKHRSAPNFDCQHLNEELKTVFRLKEAALGCGWMKSMFRESRTPGAVIMGSETAEREKQVIDRNVLSLSLILFFPEKDI